MNPKPFFLILGLVVFILSSSGQEADSITTAKSTRKSERQAARKSKKENVAEKPAPDENRYAKYNNIYDLIRTELPEVQVTGNTFIIRGYTSLTGSSQPKFVVDGVIMEQIEDISPNRVRSIRVLKGGAAAIYGINGANGIIEITTIRTQGTK